MPAVKQIPYEGPIIAEAQHFANLHVMLDMYRKMLMIRA